MATKKVPIQDEFNWQLNIKSRITAATLAGLSPAKGDRYILTDGANINKIATYNSSTWDYLVPTEGFICWIDDENLYYKFDGTNWSIEIGATGTTGAIGTTGAEGADGTTGLDGTTGITGTTGVGLDGTTGANGTTGIDGTTGATGASGVVTRGTFDNSDLSTGILTITHSKGYSAPYTIIVAIFDNNNKQIIPDDVTGATDTVLIDLISFGTITGTWGYAYVV